MKNFYLNMPDVKPEINASYLILEFFERHVVPKKEEIIKYIQKEKAALNGNPEMQLILINVFNNSDEYIKYLSILSKILLAEEDEIEKIQNVFLDTLLNQFIIPKWKYYF